MIIGTNQDKTEDIMPDMKTHTSKQLRQAIKGNPNESRREWMLGMKQRAGKENSNNKDFHLWHRTIIRFFWRTQTWRISGWNTRFNPVQAGIVEKPEIIYTVVQEITME
jgi:hypothetical protein